MRKTNQNSNAFEMQIIMNASYFLTQNIETTKNLFIISGLTFIFGLEKGGGIFMIDNLPTLQFILGNAHKSPK